MQFCRWAALNDRTPDQQIFILLDCSSVTDLSSGCDFCAVRLNFETREVRVESHKRHAAVLAEFSGDTMSLTLSGISLVKNLRVERRKPGDHSVGLAVYGKTRCYVKRFRVAPASPAAGDDEDAPAATARKATTSYGPCANIMAASNMANEEAELID
eukprot:Skav227391  [mRNA]  locus=scaffold3215:83816:87324:- [translate_table: standard]